MICMKRVDIRCRENVDMELFELDQLYGVLNEEYDIHVNGSIKMNEQDYGNIKKVKVYANLCNKDGEILYVLNNYYNYSVYPGNYKSFSMYCSTIGRFFEADELDYVELYLSFNEKDSE